MKAWPFDDYCEHEYHDPANRRFHAQPVACPVCGPHYYLRVGARNDSRRRCTSFVARSNFSTQARSSPSKAWADITSRAMPRNAESVAAMRARKFRKEKPFAVMVETVAAARELAEFSEDAVALLTSIARPIVLAPARIDLPGVAPDNRELGIMLPYTPLHHLLFAAGAPHVLVMTSANRSERAHRLPRRRRLRPPRRHRRCLPRRRASHRPSRR